MKRTRKSLFISTVLMVVLLVVAISTATFAWYSAQSTATAQNAKLTTAATTDANIALSTVDGTWSNVVQLTAQPTFIQWCQYRYLQKTVLQQPQM